MMDQASIFWNAYWAGLGAPVWVFSATPAYPPYLSGCSVAQTFSCVGAYLDQASGVYWNVGQPSTGQELTASSEAA
jgi:hypothetical protein